LERTLDDSAARRVAIPEAFLAVDECLGIYERLAGGIRVYPEMVRRNLEKFGAFAGTEALLMKAVERGGDRQEVHERIREVSFRAWESVMRGEPNPLEEELANEKLIVGRLTKKELHELLDATNHIGNAPGKCKEFVHSRMDPIISKYRKRRAKADLGY
jgi:adenylosuccinate lyase